MYVQPAPNAARFFTDYTSPSIRHKQIKEQTGVQNDTQLRTISRSVDEVRKVPLKPN